MSNKNDKFTAVSNAIKGGNSSINPNTTPEEDMMNVMGIGTSPQPEPVIEETPIPIEEAVPMAILPDPVDTSSIEDELRKLKEELMRRDIEIGRLQHMNSIQNNIAKPTVKDKNFWKDSAFQSTKNFNRNMKDIPIKDLDEHLKKFKAQHTSTVDNFTIEGTFKITFEDATIKAALASILMKSAELAKNGINDSEVDKFVGNGYIGTQIADLIVEDSTLSIAELLGIIKNTVKVKNPIFSDEKCQQEAERIISGLIGTNYSIIRDRATTERVRGLFVCFKSDRLPTIDINNRGVKVLDENLMRKIISPLCGAYAFSTTDVDNKITMWMIDLSRLFFNIQSKYKAGMFQSTIAKKGYELNGSILTKAANGLSIKLQYVVTY